MRLTVAVTVLCAIIGTGAAWLVERTDAARPADLGRAAGRPAGHPGLRGQLRLGLAVDLGARLPRRRPGHDAGRLPAGLPAGGGQPAGRRPEPGGGGPEPGQRAGCAPSCRITLGQARGAILGGCLLVALVLLAEYGAFELLGYQTFTTEIFTEFNLSFSVPAACALSLVLVGAQPAGAGRRGPGPRAAAGRPGWARARSGSAPRCGWAGPRWPAAGRGHRAGRCSRSGVPVASSIYWIFEGGIPSVTGGSVSMLERGAGTPPPTAPVGRGPRHCWPRCPSRCWPSGTPAAARHFLERSTYLVLAMPGVVIGFALAYFTEHYAAGGGYQTAPLLVDLLRDHVLPARPGRGEGRHRPGPGQPGRDGPLAGPGQAARRCAGSPCGWPALAWPPPSAWCSCRSSPSSPPRCC